MEKREVDTTKIKSWEIYKKSQRTQEEISNLQCPIIVKDNNELLSRTKRNPNNGVHQSCSTWTCYITRNQGHSCVIEDFIGSSNAQKGLLVIMVRNISS